MFATLNDTLVEDDIRVINVSYCLVQALTLTLYSQMNKCQNIHKSTDMSGMSLSHMITAL